MMPTLLILLALGQTPTGRPGPASDVSGSRVRATGASTTRSLADHLRTLPDVQWDGVTVGSAQVTATGGTTARALKDHLRTLPDVQWDAVDVGRSVLITTGSTTARSLRDRFGDVYNVLDFIPAPYHAGIRASTDTHDLTSYIQSAITTAGKGTVVFPIGTYHHTGLSVTDSVTLMGAAWSWGGTRLKNLSATNHGISIVNADMVGARIFNLDLWGDGLANPSVAGAGIYIRGEGNNLIERVYIERAKYGIQIEGTTSVLTIRDCRIQASVLDGIYGRPNLGQINAVNVLSTHIVQNGRNGMNLWPTQGLNIRNNVIQGNAEVGILFDPTDMTTSISTNDIVIEENWLEANAKGAIVARASRDAGTGEVHYVRRLSIEKNVMSIYSPAAPGTYYLVATELIGSGHNSPFQGFFLGHNDFEGSGSLAGWVNFNSAHDHTSIWDAAFVNDGDYSSYANVGSNMTIRAFETWTRYDTHGDSDATMIPRAASKVTNWSVALTADRAVTLDTARARHGDTLRIMRTGGNTGGPWSLNVGPGPLKGLAQNSWCDVTYNGSAWVLTAYGAL